MGRGGTSSIKSKNSCNACGIWKVDEWSVFAATLSALASAATIACCNCAIWASRVISPSHMRLSISRSCYHLQKTPTDKVRVHICLFTIKIKISSKEYCTKRFLRFRSELMQNIVIGCQRYQLLTANVALYNYKSSCCKEQYCSLQIERWRKYCWSLFDIKKQRETKIESDSQSCLRRLGMTEIRIRVSEWQLPDYPP